MANLPRIYFDTNEGTHDWGYELTLRRSLRDLDAISPQLRDGLHVIIYMPGELEMEATLKFDLGNNRWVALPIDGTIVDLT